MDSKEPVEAPPPNKTKLDDEKDKRSFFSGVTLRGAVTLQKALGINEETFRMVSGHGLQDSRAFYLYCVLDVVLKAATAMLRWEGFLQNTEEKEKADKELAAHITRVVHEAVQDEQHLWSRKLVELLCDLDLIRK